MKCQKFFIHCKIVDAPRHDKGIVAHDSIVFLARGYLGTPFQDGW